MAISKLNAASDVFFSLGWETFRQCSRDFQKDPRSLTTLLLQFQRFLELKFSCQKLPSIKSSRQLNRKTSHYSNGVDCQHSRDNDVSKTMATVEAAFQ